MTTSFMPIGEFTYVDGKCVQLVNWMDYKGWEVRLAAVSDEDNYQKPRFLGYVHQHEVNDLITWAVDLAPYGDSFSKGSILRNSYETRDAAIRRLFAIEGVR